MTPLMTPMTPLMTLLTPLMTLFTRVWSQGSIRVWSQDRYWVWSQGRYWVWSQGSTRHGPRAVPGMVPGRDIPLLQVREPLDEAG